METHHLNGHSNYVMGVAFWPLGPTLASASWDHTVKLWDLRTGRETRTLHGHTGWIYAIAFSPDGSTLVSSSEDNTTRLWDALAPQVRAERADWAKFSRESEELRTKGDQFVQLLKDRGHVYADLGRAAEAASQLARALERQPEDLYLWYDCAIAQLAAGDLPSYRRTCVAMLDRFGNTDDPEVANTILYTCLPVRDAVPDVNRLMPIAEVAARQWPGAVRALAATLYRAGQYEECIQRFDEAAEAASPRAWDWLFIAMAHHHLGHTKMARECFDKGVNWSRQNPVPWTERAESENLRKEAEELLGTSL
jgi:tetratricopeptide (TPR) repeat protein